jgi:hypothetical protein
MVTFFLVTMITFACAFGMIGIGIESEDFKTRVFYVGLGICFIFVGVLLGAPK